MTRHSILDQILTEVRESRREGCKVLVVFDLDSTLFNVTGRTRKILQKFSENLEIHTKYPEEMKILARVDFTPKDWGLRVPLMRAGLPSTSTEFFGEMRDFWVQHFFSNRYLREDIPYEGAVEFLLELKEAGAHIMYLTGRDIERMGEGTKASLKQWNFPLEEDSCTLMLKPHQDLDDAQFKKDIFLNLADDYKSVWFFENEPVNVHLVASACPRVQIVYFDSTHSGRAKPPTAHPIIQTYRKPPPSKGKA